MAPDLNSLPPSSPRANPASGQSISGTMAPRAMTSAMESPAALRGQSPSPSPRSASISLQAAAAVNAGLQHEDSRRSSTSSSISRSRQSPHTGRRRSTVLMNLQLNDPTIPSPGEMITEHQVSSYRTSSPQSLGGSPILAAGDPHHLRNPSLGEIHQELEQEQEAQVNRLLQMIRHQQQQLQQLQSAAGQPQTLAAVDDSTPTSERSLSFSTTNPNVAPTGVTPRSPGTTPHPRSSFDMARADIQRRSRTPSRTASPRLRSSSISADTGDNWSLGGRDENAFYQAETQMLVRENQMLRLRIRELERQINDLHANSAITHEPATASSLSRTQSISETEPEFPAGSAEASEAPKDE